MASNPIRIKDLPSDATPNIADVLPVDNGATRKTSIADLVNAVAPVASTEEAEAGVDNTKRMTAARVKEAIAAQIGDVTGTMAQEDAADYTPTSGLGAAALSNSYDDLDDKPSLGTAAVENVEAFATAAQGSLADTALQPDDVGTAAAEDVGFFATAAQGSTADTASAMIVGSGWGKDEAISAVPDDDLDTVVKGGVYRGLNTTNGRPLNASTVVVHTPVSGTTAIQVAYTFNTPPRVYMRVKASSTWGAWSGDVSGADKATTAYVDSAVSGIGQQIAPVRAATTANITLSGTQTIDGVSVVAGNRVLAKNQSTGADNGVYVVAAGAWSRATDSDTWDEVRSKRVFVEEGTTNAGSTWSNTNVSGGSLGTDPVTYVKSAAGQVYTGSDGVDVSGTVVSIDSPTLAIINSALQAADVGWGANNAIATIPGDNLDTVTKGGAYQGLTTTTGRPLNASTVVIHTPFSSSTALQVAYTFHTPPRVYMRVKASSVWGAWSDDVSGAGRAAIANDLSDLADKTTAQKNLGIIKPAVRYGATGAGGSTDVNAVTAMLAAAKSEFPSPQVGVQGSIKMSQIITRATHLEPFMDYWNAVVLDSQYEAAKYGKAFVFDGPNPYWAGTARSASIAQGDSSGYLILPQIGTVVWEQPLLFNDWPLAFSPNIFHRTATMGAGVPVTGPGGDHIRPSHRTLTVGPGHGFVRGDRVRLIATTGHDDISGSFTGGKGESGWSTAKAEDHIVHSVTSTTVTFFDYVELFYHITSAQPVLQKYVDEPQLRLINPWMIGPGRPIGNSGGGDRAINIVGGRDLRIEGGRIEDFGGAFLRLGSIMGGSVRDLYCRGTLDSVELGQAIGRGIFYGGGMSDFLFDNVHVHGGGQSFMHSGLGGTSEAAAALGISRRITHRDCTVYGAGLGAFTQHMTGDQLEYVRCSVIGGPNCQWGFDLRTPNNRLKDCYATDLPNGGAVAFRHNINGLDIDGLTTRRSVLSGIRLTAFNGNDSWAEPPGDITIQNCNIAAGGSTSAGAINISYGVQDGGSLASLGKLVLKNNRVSISGGTTVAVTVGGKWQRPIIDGLSVEGSGTGRSLLLDGAGNGAGNGPASPVVANVTQTPNQNSLLIQHTTGTIRQYNNYVLS